VTLVEPEFAGKVLLVCQGKLDFNQLLDYTSHLEARQLHALAAVLYNTWLQRRTSPFNHFVAFNLGVALSNDGDLPGAAAAYSQAMAMAPTFLQPHINLGLVQERMGQREEAWEQWRWVAAQATDAPDQRVLKLQALNHLGRTLEDATQYQDALASLTESLELDPNQPDTLHHWVFLREKICAWPIYSPVGEVSQEFMRRCTSALAMLSLSDDPALQLAAAHHFVQSKVAQLPVLPPAGPYRHDRIRIAYVSGDLCLHPVAMLTAELFELHDRDSFEVYAFCWSREDGSGLRQRVVAAMDHTFRIEGMSDEAAARLIREQEIDILVDLQGQTRGARPNLLADRPAPVQITYLGLPATTGLPSIDYVIADRFLIPEAYAPFYSEKPLYLPDIYQVSDRKRVSGPVPSRSDCGLPEAGFVFCSFNNNFKYTPEVFAAWMRILAAVPGSVLWLLADNVWAEANLRREAAAAGVDADRLFFAGRVNPDQYLARYGVADLFLDSFPFNAGTTANDALWMGLPVLTLTGRTFASRMAGALLTAAGLPELITYSLEDYVAKAVALGTSPADCARLDAHLAEVRTSGVLFDTPRFVGHLETALKALVAEPVSSDPG